MSAIDQRYPEGCFAVAGKKPNIDSEAWVAPGATLIGEVFLGAQASVWFGAVLRGDLQPVFIGPGTNVQDGALLHVGYHEPCRVGAYVTIGHGAVVHGCTVEDGAMIANKAVVLNQAVIGAGAVVAAGAVVLPGAIVPPRTMWAGVPAKQVRVMAEEPPLGHANALSYLKLVEEYRRSFQRL